MPKVSVIIPVYNVEKYLKQCLDSVINQTLKDIEIICINDGSTDTSGTILKEYAQKDSRIKIIIQENKGLSVARNSGLEIAQGEYVGFVDSDDYVDSNFYKKLYDSAKKNKADIAFTSIIKFEKDKEDIFFKVDKEVCETNAQKKYMLCGIPKYCYVWNRIYKRKKLLSKHITFLNNIKFEDQDFSHKAIYYLWRVVSVPGTAYHYRKRSDSIVNNRSDERDYCLRAQKYRSLLFVQSNDIKLNQKQLDSYHWNEKTEYKLFFIPIITIKIYGNLKQYYLFGMCKIFEIKNSNKLDFSGYNLEFNKKE